MPYTAGGLLGSILIGALIAEYLIGQISPVAQTSDRVATLRNSYDSSGSIVPQLHDVDVARATWAGPVYGASNEVEQLSTADSKDGWLDDMEKLEARWAREDRERDAALARASAEMSRKIEADALRAVESAPTPTTPPFVAEPPESPADPLVSDPPPTYGQDLEVRRY
ncbi:hypothetical protein [Sphingomonas sp. TZW2008]|uniref:hypothetical protein n=1 Tax=Sphingomonas sp. TZW2008 TaxID=1917973 RepID=UPI0011818B0D|nr:hypothetical protein [Sphingomonas sp. TZW2008]